MNDFEILETLQKAVGRAVVASIMPELPVRYVLRTFEVPNDQKYLEVVFLPNNQTNGFWGNEKNYQGTLRLILHWPKDDEGAYPAGRAIASIASYFSKDMILSGVKISDNPDLTGVLEEKGENLVPVSVRYQSYRR